MRFVAAKGFRVLATIRAPYGPLVLRFSATASAFTDPAREGPAQWPA